MVKPLETFFRIRDAKNLVSTIVIPVSQSAAIADLEGFVDQMSVLIQACINGVVESAGYSIISHTDDDTPDATSDVQESAVLSFSSIDGYPKKLSLPTFDEAKMMLNSILVNIADAAIAALITAMIDGLTVNAHIVQPVTSHNEDLTALDAAVEHWGKRRG